MAIRKKTSLGKGLHELLAASLGSDLGYVPLPKDIGDNANLQTTAAEGDGELLYLAVETISTSPYQPRKDIDPEALEELANSIRAQGIIQPIVVRPLANNHYELVAGERRWRAAQLAGLEKVPALVKNLTNEAASAIALIENIQRENLNPMEEAYALKRLADEFNCTHREVAIAIGKSRTTVTNLLRLMELNDDVKALLEHGDIEMGHARALLGLTGKPQSDAARTVVARGLSVRETERLLKDLKDDRKETIKKARINPDIGRLQQDLSEKLGASVQIRHSLHGRGIMMIRYNTLDELDGILEHIK